MTEGPEGPLPDPVASGKMEEDRRHLYKANELHRCLTSKFVRIFLLIYREVPGRPLCCHHVQHPGARDSSIYYFKLSYPTADMHFEL